jgi:hypothetical protein
MKKITIQILCLAMVVVAFSVTETFAQRIRFKNGKAKVSANVKANGKKTFTVSGSKFKNLTFRQTGGRKFKYEISRGSKFLSSGHTTGVKTIASNCRSSYRITIINEAEVARKIVLSINIGVGELQECR